MTRSEITQYAKENGQPQPEDTRIVVETKEDAELLFKTPVGKDLIDGFKIIRNYPQSVRLGTDYYINVYFLKQNYYAFVKLLAVYEFLSGYQRIILLGFLQANYEKVNGLGVKLTEKQKKFSEAIGDNPMTRSELQEQEKLQMAIDDPNKFVASFIYIENDLQKMEYAPQKTLVDNAIMVIHPVFTSQTYSNDCLTKGVNFLVGYPYFTH